MKIHLDKTHQSYLHPCIYIAGIYNLALLSLLLDIRCYYILCLFRSNILQNMFSRVQCTVYTLHIHNV